MHEGLSPGMIVEETRSFKAQGAITKYAVVCLWGAVTGEVTLPASANASPAGVAEYGVADTKMLSVVVKGQMRCVAAGVIAREAWVVINGTAGRVKTDPATSATVSKIVGKALTPAAAAGDILIVELRFFERYNA